MQNCIFGDPAPLAPEDENPVLPAAELPNPSATKLAFECNNSIEPKIHQYNIKNALRFISDHPLKMIYLLLLNMLILRHRHPGPGVLAMAIFASSNPHHFI